MAATSPQSSVRNGVNDDTFEMRDLSRSIHGDIQAFEDAVPGEAISELPPVDRGRGAWGFVVGAFIIEGLCWGFLFSFGVFQRYLSAQKEFQGSKSISTIGTLATGLAYLLCPFTTVVSTRYPKHRKSLMYLGLATCASASLLASFASKIWHLLLTQGIMYGIGTSFLYFTTLGLMNEWFVERRGLASGIGFGGAGIFGLGMPFLLQKLLVTLGYKTTLKIWAISLVTLIGPSLFFLINTRVPISQASTSRRTDLSFLKNPIFIFMAFSALLQGLGYFIPGIYLPSYASDLSMTSIQSTLVLSLFNLSTVIGQVMLGYMADRRGTMMPSFLSSFVGSIALCLIWGYSKSFAPLVIFSIVYGFSAGGYTCLWAKFAMEVSREDPNAQLAIMGILSFERGIGNVVAGPVSAALIGTRERLESYAISKYEGMVLFAGVTMLVSSVSVFGNFFKTTPVRGR